MDKKDFHRSTEMRNDGAMSNNNEMKLFPLVLKAVQALEACCDKGDGLKTNYPIASSEVYNETWMLRMTLAFLHDYSEDFKCVNTETAEVLTSMRELVRRRWISEGGLHPVFEREGPTWTDAIIGDVVAGKEIGGKKHKRDVDIKMQGNDYAGIAVIEAKIGSAPDKAVTHSDDYNQVARNIACLAQLVMNQEPKLLEDKYSCSFILLGPGEKCKSWKGSENYKQLITGSWDIIKRQTPDRKAKVDDMSEDGMFKKIVAKIVEHSDVISWRTMIEAMKPENGNDELNHFYSELNRFHTDVIKENSRKGKQGVV